MGLGLTSTERKHLPAKPCRRRVEVVVTANNRLLIKPYDGLTTRFDAKIYHLC